MAERIDLPDFARGDTWTSRVEFLDENGSPQPISGWEFWLTLKLNPMAPDEEAAAQVRVVASGAEAEQGRTALVIPPDVTETLLPTTYRYDIQFVTPDGQVRTLALGRVKVIADITRSRQ